MSAQSTPLAVVYKPLDFLGHPGYRVGDDGSVWSCRRTGDWRLLRPTPLPIYGYLQVSLGKAASVFRKRYVHHLVLLAFVGPCPDGMECCHHDRNPANNVLANLRWDSPAGNSLDKLRHGTVLRGEQCGSARLTETLVLEIFRLRSTGLRPAAIARALRLGCSNVHTVLLRQTWGHIAIPSAFLSAPQTDWLTGGLHVPVGENHHAARLTEKAVRDIRQRSALGCPRRSLAEQYGISRQTVHDIIHRRSWGHLAD